MQTVIQTVQLTKYYRDFWGRLKAKALDHLDLTVYEGEILGVILPDKVTLRVAETPMGDKGNSQTNTQKEATLETGLVIRVPMFINTGDLVVVNTETAKYDSRDKE